MNSREKILSVVLLTEGTLETGCLVRPEAVEQIVHTALDLNLILQAELLLSGCVSDDVRGESDQPGQPGQGEGGHRGEDVLGCRHALQQMTDPW